ncbi:hypothetical protein HDK77DRAFT_440136 [Phyllosticta capitalensis]
MRCCICSSGRARSIPVGPLALSELKENGRKHSTLKSSHLTDGRTDRRSAQRRFHSRVHYPPLSFRRGASFPGVFVSCGSLDFINFKSSVISLIKYLFNQICTTCEICFWDGKRERERESENEVRRGDGWSVGRGRAQMGLGERAATERPGPSSEAACRRVQE